MRFGRVEQGLIWGFIGFRGSQLWPVISPEPRSSDSEADDVVMASSVEFRGLGFMVSGSHVEGFAGRC